MTEDSALIKQTLAAYCHRVDSGTAAEVAELFHQNAVLRPYFDGKYDVNGRAQIRAWYAHYHENFRANVRHLKHSIGAIAIDLDGNAAKSVCHLLASFVRNADEIAYFLTGTYTDELVKEDDAWLFKDRLIVASVIVSQPEFTETFPSLGWPGGKRS